MRNRTRIIVVGGGAAGMMAAGAAARTGAKVLLLEKMAQPGRKLAITGKGRCNLTNICEIGEFIEHFGKNGRFLRQTFHHFFNRELIDFFVANGLQTVSERGGRIFPLHGKAPEVVSVMRKWLNKNGVTIRLNSPVEKLLIQDNKIAGVTVQGEEFPAAAVILATGGASYPKTGSTGDGYALAESCGHTIISPGPALIPLVCADKLTDTAQGLTLRNIGVTLYIQNKKAANLFGELLFTEDGVSGPTILSLSLQVVKALKRGDQVEIELDLKPALDEKKLDNRLIRDFHRRGKENLASILRGLIPRELLPACFKMTAVDPERQGHQITSQERKRLRLWLKGVRLTISGHRPLAEAIITAGGVNLKEINPKTMASRLVDNLFIAGELLDLQADTGGYNLQAAFSTGHLAGSAAADLSI